MTPEEYVRAFAQAFGDQNAEAFADLIAKDGTMHSLTGAWAEGLAEVKAAFAAEAAGIFARARLVTGKGSVVALAHDVALLRQRFVVTGALDEQGAEIPRFGAMLVAVLKSDGQVWRGLNLSFSLVA